MLKFKLGCYMDFLVQTFLGMLYGHMLPLHQIYLFSEAICVLLISFCSKSSKMQLNS